MANNKANTLVLESLALHLLTSKDIHLEGDERPEDLYARRLMAFSGRTRYYCSPTASAAVGGVVIRGGREEVLFYARVKANPTM